MFSRLRLHLITKHKHLEEIRIILTQTKTKQKEQFGLLINKGIHKFNQYETQEGNATNYQCTRRSKKQDNDALRPYCIDCKKFLIRKYFKSHKCISTDSSKERCILSGLSDYHAADFEKFVLPQLNNDAVGETVKTEKLLIALGLQEYKLRYNPHKKHLVARRVRHFLRALADLYLKAKKVANGQNKTLSFSDLYSRKNMAIIELVIESTASSDTGLTSKKNLGYVIKSAAKSLKTLYLMADDDEKATEVGNFLDCFHNRWNYIFKASETASAANRHEKSRMPVNLANEADIKKLRHYIEIELGRYNNMKNIPNEKYVEIRRLVYIRLLLLNARRANEIANMTIPQMKQALDGTWTYGTQETVSNEAKSKYYITYISAKNQSKPVDTLIPKSLKNLCLYLINISVRKSNSIIQNSFVFASKSSGSSSSGYHDLKTICERLNIKDFTATDYRHLISTKRAKRPSTKQDDELFYEHMGHHENMNKYVYQTPRAQATIESVGTFLHEHDEAIREYRALCSHSFGDMII